MKSLFLALAVLSVAAVCAYGQRAYRAPLITHVAADGGTTNETFRFSDYAAANETSWAIAWLRITTPDATLTNTVNMEVVAYDGKTTNYISSVVLEGATTSNLNYYAAPTTLGRWPAADTLRFSVGSTGESFVVEMGLEVTK